MRSASTQLRGGSDGPGQGEVAGLRLEVRGDCFLKDFRRNREVGDRTEVGEVVGFAAGFGLQRPTCLEAVVGTNSLRGTVDGRIMKDHLCNDE